MKRGLLILFLSMMLGGCAMPVGVQVASWAMDGISYIATKKSMTDHGLSIVTQRDCAMWRVVKQEEICVKYDDATTAIAALDDEDDNFEHTPSDIVTAQIDENQQNEAVTTDLKPIVVADNSQITDIEIEKLASFETAAGIEENQVLQADKIVPAKLKSPQNNKFTGYSADVFSAAVKELKTRGRNLSLPTNTEKSQKTRKNIISASAKSSKAFRDLQGHSAASFSTAWAFTKGHTEPKVRWVFAASPTPQQEYDLAADTVEIAANDEIEPQTTVEPEISKIEPINSDSDITELDEQVAEVPSLTSTENTSSKSLEYSENISQDSDSSSNRPLTKSDYRASHTVKQSNLESVYFVVASFDSTSNAEKLLKRHRSLDIQLIVGNLDGRQIYRGIVGPYHQSDMEQAKQRIWRAGVKNPWAIRLDRDKWTFLYSASLSEELSLRY